MRNEGIFKAERQDNMGEISGVMRIKVNGEWLPVASIVGPTGERGPTGPGGGEPGDTGPTGPQGPTGPTGEMFKYEDLTPSQVLDLAGKMGRNKADIVADATAGDLAGLDAVGNLVDSGIPAGDVLRKSQMDSTPTAGSLNPVTSDGIKQAIDAATPSDYDQVRSQVSQNASDIGAIEEKIPPQASAQNQLADKEFVNSSIATNTATFRGTYNLVTDLGLTTSATHEQVAAAVKTKLAALSITPDHNDYCFVQVPRTDAEPTVIARIDRYKCSVEDGVASWDYEWSLNNSSFTANQWAAINSGITSALVEKLGALPTAQELAAALAGKASTADVTLTPIYSDTPTFSEWSFSGNVSSGVAYTVVEQSDGPDWWGYLLYADGVEIDGIGDFDKQQLTVEFGTYSTGITATRTRTDIIGYTLGSQSDKPLQPKGDYALLSDIAVKSVKLNGTALTPDASGAVNVPALPLTGGTMTGDLTAGNLISRIRAVSISGAVSGAKFILQGASDEHYIQFAYQNSKYGLFVKNGAKDAGTFYALADFAPLASPEFTGTPTAPTPASGDNSTKVATTAFVQAAVAGGGGGTPLSGQTFNFATTQGVMDALKTVIETLGGTVINAPSTTISQGE